MQRQRAIYLSELENFGYRGLDRLSIKEIKDTYANLMNNRRRLDYLKSWWNDRVGP